MQALTSSLRKSQTLPTLGQMLLAILKQRGELITDVNSSLELHLFLNLTGWLQGLWLEASMA